MAQSHYRRQAILKQDVRFHPFHRARGLEREHKIHLPFEQQIHKLGHRFIEYVELHFRIHAHERHQRLGKYRAE